LRTRQDELTGAAAFGIDCGLDVAEQAGRILHLIDHEGRPVAGEKRFRIVFGLFGFTRQVKGDELVFGEEAPDQTCLACLSGSRQHHDRSDGSPLDNEGFDFSRYPHRAYVTIESNKLQVLADKIEFRRVRVVAGPAEVQAGALAGASGRFAPCTPREKVFRQDRGANMVFFPLI
jgi:hypothetical protein